MNRVKIFTHCDLDGIGCAVLAKLAFGNDVDISYCGYDDIDEEVLSWHFSIENIMTPCYITDISVNEETAAILNKNRSGLFLFDHHATALGLNKYDWAMVQVENEDGIKTSGTELFYEYLNFMRYFNDMRMYSLRNIELFVEMVRDYDTWRWKELGEKGELCKQLNDLFYIYGREKFIAICINRITSDVTFPNFQDLDKVLLENKQREIDKYIEAKDKQLHRYCDRFGYICGVVFADRFVSELGNRLAELHPELHYIAIINVDGGTVSYRSVKDDIHLGESIAHSYGGGGHAKAAGSTFDRDRVEMMVMYELFEGKEEEGEVL